MPADHFPAVMNAAGWVLIVLVVLIVGLAMFRVPLRIRRHRRMKRRPGLIIWDDINGNGKTMTPEMLEKMRAWYAKNPKEPYHG